MNIREKEAGWEKEHIYYIHKYRYIFKIFQKMSHRLRKIGLSNGVFVLVSHFKMWVQRVNTLLLRQIGYFAVDFCESHSS